MTCSVGSFIQMFCWRKFKTILYFWILQRIKNYPNIFLSQYINLNNLYLIFILLKNSALKHVLFVDLFTYPKMVEILFLCI